MSGIRGKKIVLVFVHVVVCSRGVSSVSRPPDPKAVIAAWPVATRLGVGVKSKRVGVIEPAAAVGSKGVGSIDVIGSGGVSGRQRRQRRQLMGGRCARVSAQRVAAKIFRSGCVIGRVVTPFSSCRRRARAGGFAVWRAAWRYGGCWSARRVIESGVGVGVVSG
jgi:hypothetical protein